VTRGQTLAVKTEDYVEGARPVGLGHFRIISRYILPNIFSAILVAVDTEHRRSNHR
jgi:peptide/nickel transport system permease protein